ncbi:hypothetical protein B0H11DRAFT_2029301, partial [Mycena galericulata]
MFLCFLSLISPWYSCQCHVVAHIPGVPIPRKSSAEPYARTYHRPYGGSACDFRGFDVPGSSRVSCFSLPNAATSL